MGWTKKSTGDLCDDFVDEYVAYASKLTDASIEYHHAAALWLVSSCVRRNLYIDFEHATLYPNCWFLLIGESGISRKSTCMNIADSILKEIKDVHQIPSDFSPEALIEHMSIHSKGYWTRDEFGGFLADLNKQYMQGVKELYMKLYDCIDHYERELKKETYLLTDVYFTVLAASTPIRLAKNLDREDAESGFLARFIIISPSLTRDKWKGFALYTDEDAVIKKRLINTLNYISAICAERHEVLMDSEVIQTFNNWLIEHEEQLLKSDDISLMAPFYARLQEYVVKLSIIYEVSKVAQTAGTSGVIPGRSYKMNISLTSLMRAIYYIEDIKRKYLMDIRTLVSMGQLETIYRILKAKNGSVDHSVILRNSNMSAQEFRGHMRTLIEQERVIVKTVDKRTVYTLIENDDGKGKVKSMYEPGKSDEEDAPEADVSDWDLDDKEGEG